MFTVAYIFIEAEGRMHPYGLRLCTSVLRQHLHHVSTPTSSKNLFVSKILSFYPNFYRKGVALLHNFK